MRVGAAIERAGRHQIVARLQQAADRQELGRLSAGGGQRTYTAFKRGDALFEHGGGGIHDAGVNVAEALESEQSRGVIAVFEDEGGGLIDGHRARAGGRIGLLARVQ